MMNEAESPAPDAEPTPADTPVEAVETKPAPAPVKQEAKGGWWWGLGRRKASVARVRIRPGDGKFIINKRPYTEYLTEERDHKDLMDVLQKTSTEGSIDVYVNVRGGGYTGQAGAIRAGARACTEPLRRVSLEPILRVTTASCPATRERSSARSTASPERDAGSSSRSVRVRLWIIRSST